MTIKYRTVPTTYEVYRSIVNAHANDSSPYSISVYESITDLRENGPNRIYTVWGLKDAEVALVGAETTYETEYDLIISARKNRYFLCAAYEENEE